MPRAVLREIREGGVLAWPHVVELVADRFVTTSDGTAIDLATCMPVVLKIGAGGGASEQHQWSLRCETFNAVHHPRIAWLVDFGALGVSQRFEAWDCSEKWHEAPDAEETIHAAVRFLRSCGLQPGTVSRSDVYKSSGRSVLMPVDETGHVGDVQPDTANNPLENCGICAIDRRADKAIDELFTSFTGSRPHLVTIWGPPGSGRTTTIVRAARVARVNGFVPVDIRALDRIDIDLLRHRQLCLIRDGDHAEPWSGVLRSVLASPRGHIVLQVATEETGALQSVALERIPPAALAAAVRPQEHPAGAHEQIARVAAAAQGLPGRFAALMWHSRTYRCPGAGGQSRPTVSRVAEQVPTYGSVPPIAPAQSRGHHRDWPAPSDLAALRRRVAFAVDLLKKGRHAPAVRQLRQAIGGFTRRGDFSHAADAVVTLASALLLRGDPRGALTVLDPIHRRPELMNDQAVLVDLAIISGQAWIDLARLEDSESVLGTAVAVARRTGDGPRLALASLALSRCLFWKGRYDEAASAAAAVTAANNGLARSLLVGEWLETARASVGLGDFVRAMTLAREAIDEAGRLCDDRLRARALAVASFVRLAVGDADGVRRDVATSIAAARAAHDPLASVRARLLLVENERRCGRPGTAASYLKRLQRIGLPAIIQARIDLLQALIDRSGTSTEIATRCNSRYGLAALALYVAPPSIDRPGRLSESTEALIGILHLCQTADDELRVLGELCARLRQQLHAAAVAVLVREGASALASVASAGPRIDSEVAVRAVMADIPVAPHRVNDRIEAAAPVRYAGAVIGAIVVRWPVGTPYDLSGAVSTLTMSATAAAPVVSAAIGRRSPTPAPALDSLIGVTAVMSELRGAVERTAKAPFAVLIEGESGSGKELVAKAIHRLGESRNRPFCTLNCAALPDDLVEAELFGHARGAFTGAVNERAGVFEEAHGGTLFLDEVGELSPRAQAKLLRVIQEGELRRIGENAPRRVDVRIVSATNRDLRSEVAAGRFRLDLLYRLDVVRLRVPPLRERREDIVLLADRFWREATGRIGSRAVLSAAATAALARYDWPGNVRELQNVLAALAVRTPRRGVVTPTALPPQFAGTRPAEDCRLDVARRTFEERFVRAALVRTGGHRGRAASELGLTRQGLTKLMARLGIGTARPPGIGGSSRPDPN